MENQHQERVRESVQRIRIYPRNQKRKIEMIRIYGKNTRTKVVKKVFKNTPEGKESVGTPRKRWLDDAKNDLKKMYVTGWKSV
jgi:hypothetical protein